MIKLMENCYIMHFEKKGDIQRGFLVSLEENNEIPFIAKRVYYIFDTPPQAVRGYHAHKKLRQLLVCVHGSVTVECEDADGERAELILSEPDKGLFVGEMVWHTMKNFQEGTVLLVIADNVYNEKEYIRDFSEFIKLAGRKG